MSNEQDTSPKVGEVWHGGQQHEDGTCIRYRCTAIQEPRGTTPRLFVMEALAIGTDDAVKGIVPKAVTKKMLENGGWHGPEGVEATEEQIGETPLFDALVNAIFGQRPPVHVRPIIIPKGVPGQAASDFLNDVSAHLMKVATEKGLDGAKAEWAKMAAPRRDGALDITQDELKQFEISAFDRGDSKGYDRGRSIGNLEAGAANAKRVEAARVEGGAEGFAEGIEVGRQEADRERAMHPYAPALKVMCDYPASVVVTVLDAKHGMTHRAIGIDTGEERGSKRRFSSTGPLDDQRVRAILRDVMIPADVVMAEGIERAFSTQKKFPADWAQLLEDAKATGYSAGEHAGITAGVKAHDERMKNDPAWPIFEVLTEDSERPRIVVIGRDFESWAVLTRMHGVVEVGGTYSHRGVMAPAFVQGALTECLSTFDPALATTLAGWPGGILNSMNSIAGNTRTVTAIDRLGARKAPPPIPAGWTYDGRFFRNPKGSIEGWDFHDEWQSRASEFPQVAPKIADPAPDTAAPVKGTGDPNYGGHPKPTVVELRAAVRLLVRYSHGNSLASGWWPEVKPDLLRVGKMTHSGQRNFGELVSLIHSEISEALEGYRKNKDDDHLPHHKNVTVELADALHRIFDLAGAMRLSLAEAYVDKGEFNLVRLDHKKEAREAPGGKQF